MDVIKRAESYIMGISKFFSCSESFVFYGFQRVPHFVWVLNFKCLDKITIYRSIVCKNSGAAPPGGRWCFSKISFSVTRVKGSAFLTEIVRAFILSKTQCFKSEAPAVRLKQN